MLDITTKATRELGTLVVIFLNPKTIKMVPKASPNSNQLIFLIALGIANKAPKAPEVSLAAKVSDSCKISAAEILSALSIVTLKSSNTRIPSPASSFKIFSRITSWA
jgi:hypothetical protein